MRFGILVPQFGAGWLDSLGVARRAEAAGYDDLWVADHLQGIPNPETPVLECWTTLAGLAGATERIGLGTLVLAAGFRSPRVLGRAAGTLAEIAPDRLTLGLGAGWVEREHLAFGLPFPPFRERIARLEETVDAVRELAPSVPVLIGGAGEAARDLAARKADLWSVPGHRLDDLPELAEGLRGRCRETGREVEIVSRVGVLPADTVTAAEARLARRTSNWTRIGLGPLGLVGDAGEIASRVERHLELGVSRIVLGFAPRDLADETLERFADEIVARFRV